MVAQHTGLSSVLARTESSIDASLMESAVMRKEKKGFN